MEVLVHQKPAARPLVSAATPPCAGKSEWRPTYLAATDMADRLLGSKGEAFEVVHDAYVDMRTKHPHDPSKYPLRQHFLHLTYVACKQARARMGAATPREQQRAAEELYDEILAGASSTASPEDSMIAREEAERRARWLEEKREQLGRLLEAVSHDRVAVTLLEHWARHDDAKPLTVLGRELGIPVDALYAAKQLIERKAKRIILKKEGGQ